MFPIWDLIFLFWSRSDSAQRFGDRSKPDNLSLGVINRPEGAKGGCLIYAELISKSLSFVIIPSVESPDPAGYAPGSFSSGTFDITCDFSRNIGFARSSNRVTRLPLCTPFSVDGSGTCRLLHAMVSSFTFITTDPRRKAAREAVKVHVLRLRRRHRQRQGGNAKLGLVETSRGGQIHLWDSAVTEPVDLSPSASELLGSGSPGPSETFETTLPQTVTRLPLELSGPTYPFELEDMCSFPFTRMPEQSSESVLVHCCRY